MGIKGKFIPPNSLAKLFKHDKNKKVVRGSELRQSLSAAIETIQQGSSYILY